MEPTDFRYIGDVWYEDEWVFHVFIVYAWKGQLPATNHELNRPLKWVHPNDLQDNYYMQGLGKLIRKTIP